jgi:hypothetical protein
MKNKFSELLKKKIDRLFFILWPPFGEDKFSDIDISVGFVFDDRPNELCILSTDEEDRWSPVILYKDIPNLIYPMGDFEERVKKWMNSKEIGDFGLEYYEVKKSKKFNMILSEEIKKIELLKVEQIDSFFGVKLIFENDYILSLSNSDGNTVETSKFNKNDSLINFERLGRILSIDGSDMSKSQQ